MAYTDFIAAIDLGTSHMVGMVGTKNQAGVLSIIACEVENSGTCIKRGCVYNIEEAAMKIRRLVNKLENKLDGAKIGKLYVGLAGQSLCSIEHSVSKLLGDDGVVTDELVDSLRQECCKYHSDDMRDVFAAVSPVYYLDNKLVTNPIGTTCSRIEARYRLIVGRPSLKRNLAQSVERAKLEVAGFVISPLALADILLTDIDKERGCALVEFGAGVTTLSVYKEGNLVGLSVVPFGGNVITKDIESLHLSEQEAERLKRTYGSAISDRTNERAQLTSSIGFGPSVTQKDLNNVVEARIKEIVENVYACLERMNVLGTLDSGVIIAGGAANLKRLPDLVKDIFRMDVRYASVRRDLVENVEWAANDHIYSVVLSMMIRGSINCAVPVQKPKPQPVYTEPVVDKPVVDKPKEEEKQEVASEVKTEVTENGSKDETSAFDNGRKHKGGKSIWDKFRKKKDSLMEGLFDDIDM